MNFTLLTCFSFVRILTTYVLKIIRTTKTVYDISMIFFIVLLIIKTCWIFLTLFFIYSKKILQYFLIKLFQIHKNIKTCFYMQFFSKKHTRISCIQISFIYDRETPFCFCRRHLILSCQGRLNIFPFDDPLCSFAMESSKYITLSVFIDFNLKHV